MTGILAGEDTALLCAVSLGAGVLLGAFYDVFRVRRYAYREMFGKKAAGYRNMVENVVVFAEDILFSLTAAVLFSVLFYRFSWGAVRWYSLAFAALAFAAAISVSMRCFSAASLFLSSLIA